MDKALGCKLYAFWLQKSLVKSIDNNGKISMPFSTFLDVSIMSICSNE